MELANNRGNDIGLFVLWFLAVLYGGLVVYSIATENPRLKALAGIVLVALLVLLVVSIIYANKMTSRSGRLAVAIFSIALVLQLYILVTPDPAFGASVPSTLSMLGVLIFLYGQ
jgi:uncharacterized membrane protein